MRAALLLLAALVLPVPLRGGAALGEAEPGRHDAELPDESFKLMAVYLLAYAIFIPVFPIRWVAPAMMGLTLFELAASLAVASYAQPSARELLFNLCLREFLKGLGMNCMGIFMGLLAERNRRSNFVGAMMYHEQVVFMSTVRNDVQRLLLNTLPEPIVREVAKGQLEVAHRYDDVTVVQADMVGFTPLSAFLSAKEILGILSELFDIFDELAEEHAVHKVKTIGDAYVACCGAFDQSESPAVAAERAVRFALAMQAGVKEVASARSIDISCRVGVHTGMVMGGIIGTVRFHFDMWGPAVIGALKMEELGGRGRVHVSNATAALLPANWILELVHVMEPDFAHTYAIERSHSIVWAPSDDSTRTLECVPSEGGNAGEAVAAPRRPRVDGAAKGEAGMAEASGASATQTMSAKHIEKKLEAEMAQAMAMLSASGAEGIPKLEGWKLVSTGYRVSHEAGFVQARHARVAQPPPPLAAATKSSAAWPSWGLSRRPSRTPEGAAKERKATRSREAGGEERVAPRHSLDEGRLAGRGEASRARYLFVSDPQLVAAQDTNTPNAKLAEELRAKLHSPQAKDLRAAKKLLLKQCELLLFFSTVFGSYDFAHFWFSFGIRPGAIMGIALLRFAFLLPTLFLLRGIIRKMHRRRFFVDVTGVALVAIPAITCVLMVAAAPQYAFPCAALADTSCAFEEAAPATIPPPMPPPALPSQLDACVKFVRVDARPELCYSRDISYSYVRTLGMLYAFFGYTHLHTRLHLLVAAQTLGSLTLLGAALFTEWMRLDGLDGEQRARLQSDFILGLVTSAAWLAAAHALGLAHHAMRSQMVRNHFLLHGLQHELLSIIQQETKQCEQLLANILPPNVIGSLASMALPEARGGSHDDGRAMHHPVRAAELYKQRMSNPLNLKAVVADQYSDCSFLFAKIGGLTHLVGDTTRSPSQVLMVLQHLFDCFDRLADIYKVQKVRKTANEYYLVAAGLPDTHLLPTARDRAVGIASFGFAMITAMNVLNVELRQFGIEFTLQVGIHSGAAIAGVIGHKTFQYDLCGDSVNTAARMCTYGAPGQVHVSEATHELVKGNYASLCLGEREVKGKGMMKTFFLCNFPAEDGHRVEEMMTGSMPSRKQASINIAETPAAAFARSQPSTAIAGLRDLEA